MMRRWSWIRIAGLLACAGWLAAASAACPPGKEPSGIEQESELVWVDLRVVDDDGVALPGVRVSLVAPGDDPWGAQPGPFTGVTDENGLVDFQVAAGTSHQVQVWNPFSETQFELLDIEPLKAGDEGSIIFTLSLRKSARHTCVVVDAESLLPIGRARVYADMGPMRRQLALGKNVPKELLAPWDEADQPGSAQGQGSEQPARYTATLTDAAGRFVLSTATWRHTTAVIRADGYALRSLPLSFDGEVSSVRSVELARESPLAVQLMDAPAGVEVRARLRRRGLRKRAKRSGKGLGKWQALADHDWVYLVAERIPSVEADGASAEFVVRGLPDRTPLVVSIVDLSEPADPQMLVDDLRVRTKLPGQTATLAIDLGPVGRIHVVAADELKRPLAGARVMCWRVQDASEPMSFELPPESKAAVLVADDGGRVVFEGLVPGDYRLATRPFQRAAEDGDGGTLRCSIVEASVSRDDAQTSIVLTSRGELSIEAEVTVPGLPAVGGWDRRFPSELMHLTRIADGAQKSLFANLDHGATLSVDGLLPGAYRLELANSPRRQGYVLDPIVVEAGSVAELTFVKSAALRVSLVDATTGRPSTGVRLMQLRVARLDGEADAVTRRLISRPEKLFTELRVGAHLVEVLTPEGEVLERKEVEVTATEPDHTAEVRIVLDR